MKTPSSSTVTVTPRCSAIGAIAATTRCTTSPRLVSSRSSTAAPASNRLISSRSAEQVLEPVQLVLQQLGGTRGDRVEAARASCSTSPAIRTVVSGVRSSWETSETNVRCTRESSTSWRICDCSASAIWLNDIASRAMSSSPETCIRSSSRPDAIRSATRRASRTGVITCRVTSSATPATSSSRRARRSAAPGAAAEGLLLLLHREEVVERVGAAVGGQHDRGADGDARLVGGLVVAALACSGSACRSRPGRLAALDGRAQGVRDAVRRRPPGWCVRRRRCCPSPTGPSTTTSKPLTSPRATRFSTSSRSWVSGSKSLPPAEPSRSRAVAVSVRASATEASTRLFTSPSEICRITSQPTEPTTTALSTTMAVTTRGAASGARSRRRCSARSAPPPSHGPGPQSAAGSSAVPAL